MGSGSAVRTVSPTWGRVRARRIGVKLGALELGRVVVFAESTGIVVVVVVVYLVVILVLIVVVIR